MGLEGGRSMLLLVLIILSSVCFFSSGTDDRPHSSRINQLKASFNISFARTVVEYASAVYIDNPNELVSWTCDRCNDRIRGFQLVDLIIDVEHCLQGFVGVDKRLGSIIVAFRGTRESSIRNWAENLYFRELDFNYPGCEDNTLVHHGFYSAYHNTTLRPRVVSAVLQLVKKDKDLKILVTGHSMGGAMASFAALDLVANFGLQDVQMMTFGQPRVGNPAFADYFNFMVPNAIRMTHGHDLVPHLPPYYSFIHDRTYHHFATEVWIYNYGIGLLSYEAYRVCDSSGEDPTCCRSVVGNSVADHLIYLGVFLKAESYQALSSS